MKVLHVIPSLARAHGGPSHAIWAMVRSLDGHAIDTCVLATDENGRGEKLNESMFETVRGDAEIVLKPLTLMSYKISLRAFFWLWRNVRTYRVVHTHALFSFMPIAAAAIAFWRGVPYVMRPLGTLNAYGLRQRRSVAKKISITLIERPLLARAAAVHCTSEAERDDVRAVCPNASTVVIPLAVPKFDAATHELASQFLGSHVGQPVILFLSRLDPKKNVEVLLDAFAILAKRNPTPVLIVAGDGETSYVAKLKSRVEDEEVARRIVWAGRVDGDTKAAALTCAHVYVLPSHSENFGIAVAEALAAGLPCVVSPGVAISKEIEHYGAGIVCQPNADALADALDRLLRDEALRADASKAATRLAAQEFSQEAMGSKLTALYREIVAREKR